jgi:hypothetical protein
MTFLPGRVQPGDGSDQLPVAVVTTSRERLEEYVGAARIGPWVWVRAVADVRGLRLGGVAFLDGEQVSDDLRDELAVASLG